MPGEDLPPIDRSHKGWRRLWETISPTVPAHPIEPGVLGEYALIWHARGPAQAERMLPEVASHLASGCEQCADVLREFPAEDVLVSVPGVSEGPAIGGLRQILATLVTPPRRLASSQRGSDTGLTHIYQAEAATVSIRVTRSRTRRRTTVEGVIAGKPLYAESSATARLVGPNGGSAQEAGIDELGNFILDGVEVGTYRLELAWPDQVIVIEGLEVTG